MNLIVQNKVDAPKQVVGVLTKAEYVVNCYYKTPWADIVQGMRDANMLHLWYKLEDIQNEIDMITSILGQHRANEQAYHLLDLIRMSKDDNDLFVKFVKQTMGDIYTQLQMFTPHNKKAYFYNEGNPTKEFDSSSSYVVTFKIYDWLIDTHTNKLYMAVEDGDTSEMNKLELHDSTSDFRSSVHYVIAYQPYLDDSMVEPLDNAIMDALVNGVIYRWLKIAYPDEAASYLDNYQEQIQNIKERVHVFDSKIGYVRPRPF